MKKSLLKFLLFTFGFFLILQSKAQSTDFTMAYDSTKACGDTSTITVQVWAGGTLLWSGRPSYVKKCISGGTPTSITIIDGSCNSFSFAVNTPALVKSGNLCIFSCLRDRADTPPPYTYGFYAGYFSSGGICASPFVSGLLSLSMYPY